MNPKYLNNIFAEIKKNYNKENPKYYIVGISGIDCSGKSTVADQLSQMLNNGGFTTYTVHVDDFLYERKIRNANSNQADGYYYETFNFNKLFGEIIIPLRKREKFCKLVEVLDWENDTNYTKEYKFDTPCIVIVEGVLLFKKQFVNLFDYKIWIDIDFELGLSRALRRERDVNYYKDKEEIINRYLNRFYEGQKLYFEYDEPSKSCDYIISAMDMKVQQ